MQQDILSRCPVVIILITYGMVALYNACEHTYKAWRNIMLDAQLDVDLLLFLYCTGAAIRMTHDNVSIFSPLRRCIALILL